MLLPKLQKVREEKKLSITELAKLSEVSHGTIRRAEKGNNVLKQNAKALAKALHVKTAELQ